MFIKGTQSLSRFLPNICVSVEVGGFPRNSELKYSTPSFQGSQAILDHTTWLEKKLVLYPHVRFEKCVRFSGAIILHTQQTRAVFNNIQPYVTFMLSK